MKKGRFLIAFVIFFVSMQASFSDGYEIISPDTMGAIGTSENAKKNFVEGIGDYAQEVAKRELKKFGDRGIDLLEEQKKALKREIERKIQEAVIGILESAFEQVLKAGKKAGNIVKKGALHTGRYIGRKLGYRYNESDFSDDQPNDAVLSEVFVPEKEEIIEQPNTYDTSGNNVAQRDMAVSDDDILEEDWFY